MSKKSIEDVKSFWESNPLFSGESNFPIGTRDFFEEHQRVVKQDCFAGRIDPNVLPEEKNKDRVLDLGCGPGFWTIEMAKQGAEMITVSDLTDNALVLTRKRAEIYGIKVETSRQNAEHMTFESGIFSHVNGRELFIIRRTRKPV